MAKYFRYSEGMCIVCVEFGKGSLTPSEAIRALRELSLPETEEREHYNRAMEDIADKAAERMHAEEDLT